MQSVHEVEAGMSWLFRANRPRLTGIQTQNPDQSRGKAKEKPQVEFAARFQPSIHRECSKPTNCTKIIVSAHITGALALDQRRCCAVKVLPELRVHPSSSGYGKRVHGMLTAPVYRYPSWYIFTSGSRFSVLSYSGGRSEEYSRS